MGLSCNSLNDLGAGLQDGGRENDTPEICLNGLDDNGDGQADEGCDCRMSAIQRCFVGQPGRAGKGPCVWGMQTCAGRGDLKRWGPCLGYGTSVACQKSTDGDEARIGGDPDQESDAGSVIAKGSCPAGNNGSSAVPAWKVVRSPENTNGTIELLGVWGSGSHDVWAVGQVDIGIIHWNGSMWSPSLVGARPVQPLASVWGSGPSDVWAVGLDRILHWDGSAWLPTPTSGVQGSISLERVWGSGPRDAWAVGVQDKRGTILHWDGSAWTMSAAFGAAVKGVWGSGPRDVWAVGVGDPQGDDYGIHHWDGLVWSPVVDTFHVYYQNVWGSGPHDVWAVAYANAANSTSRPAHWDGTAWLPVSHPRSLTKIWGSGPQDIWAVGRDGSSGPLLHWDGSAWSSVCLDDGSLVEDVWGSGPNDVWAVGRQGLILRYH